MIIGITGHKQNGKNTFGLMLVIAITYDCNPEEVEFLYRKYEETTDSHFYDCYVYSSSFAAPIKEAVGNMFGVDPIKFEDEEFKNSIEPITGKTYRQLLQLFGTEIGRNIDENIWIKLQEKVIKEHRHVMFTDVRFPNEAEFIHQHDGILIKVERPENKHEDGHASEKFIDSLKEDYLILNDRDLKGLAVKAIAIKEELKDAIAIHSR